MINCALCGTKNRDGSKFCSNCGGRLTPQAGLICPMCGTANKMESVFCSSCGARLVPLIATPQAEKNEPTAPPIKGLSLPARPEANEEWLNRLRETTDEESAEPEEDVPDWLTSSKQVEKNKPPVKSEQPAWLKELDASAQSVEESITEEAPTDEVPDWLKTTEQAPEVQASQAQEPEPVSEPEPEPIPSQPTEIETSTPIEEGEIPDWLKGLQSQTPTEPEAEPEPEPAPEPPAEPSQPAAVEPLTPITEAEMPDWLKGLAPSATSEPKVEPEPEPETPVESAEPVTIEPPTPLADADMPDWLKQLKPQGADVENLTPGESLIQSIEATASAEMASQLAATPSQQVPVTNIEGVEEIPDWLRTAVAPPAAEQPIEATLAEIQPALPENVPAWIAALRPVEHKLEDEPLEASGPLAGLRGVLPLALSVAEPHTFERPTKPAQQTEPGKLFETILATQAVAPPATTTKRARLGWSMRPLIYVLLALAVLVPFFLPLDWASSFLEIDNTPTSKFFDAVQALPANATVLLAFEYDPSTAGEMDLQARAIVRHLAQKNVKIIALSTLETGAPIVRRVLDDTTRNATNYAYGTSYVNLGFFPGHETGLANLATSGFPATTKEVVQNLDFNRIPATANIKTLRDLKMIIVLAGSEDTLNQWMTQVQPRAGVAIIAGVSAAVEPKARAYRDTPTQQLKAVMSGLVGAAQYEALSNQPGLALASVNVQSIAQIVLVLIILLGNLAFWIQKARRTEAK